MGARERVGPAVQAALGHFKVSTGADVDPDAFARFFASGSATRQTAVAIESHLRECDPAELANLVIEGAATFRSLKMLAHQLLPAGHPNHVYID